MHPAGRTGVSNGVSTQPRIPDGYAQSQQESQSAWRGSSLSSGNADRRPGPDEPHSFALAEGRPCRLADQGRATGQLQAASRERRSACQLGGPLVIADAGVALAGPGRQYEQQSRVGECSHGVALSGLEHRGKPRPSDRAGDVDLTGDDHDVCALVDLVILEPLARVQRDEDRARLAPRGVQDSRLTRLYFERVQIPVLHGCKPTPCFRRCEATGRARSRYEQGQCETQHEPKPAHAVPRSTPILVAA